MSKNPEVERWLERLDHPLKATILRVRHVILGADRRIDECIKWQSPTFIFEGNLASINPKSKQKVSVMFHQGATIPGKHPSLVGGGGTVKYMYFAEESEVDDQRSALAAVVRAWCAMKTGCARGPKPNSSEKRPRTKAVAARAAKHRNHKAP